MGKIFETKIDRFDGGMVNDPREERNDVCRVSTNFDLLTSSRKMIPYRQGEDGDVGAATSKKKNFALALRTGTTYSLYALGVQSGTGIAEILYKDLSTGGSNDLDDNTWATPSAHQSSGGATNFNLFVYYKKTGLIYGAKAGTTIWAFSPTGSAFDDSQRPIAYTNIAQGLVHSKDDILYIPYDNKIAKNNNGSWTDAALTLPSYFYVTSISEYGNYLAIACEPLSGIGNSRVFLWDTTSTSWNESIDCGSGKIKVLEEIDGRLVAISIDGGNSTRFLDRIKFQYISGNKAKLFREIIGESGITASLPIAKQKIDNRLFFMLKIKLNGATREGVWSYGWSNVANTFTISHERTLNNDTALTNSTLNNFYILGDFVFQSFLDVATWYLIKTDDSASYVTSIHETKIYDGGDASLKKKLIGVTVSTEPLASGEQVVMKYKMDDETSYTTIITHDTDNELSKSAINIESTGVNLPEFKEIQFRLESTGGAKITSYSFEYEITGKRIY